MASDEPTVLIAHDYVTQRGGAERVVLSLLRAFPGAELVTSIFNPESTFPEFVRYPVHVLWPNRWATLRREARHALPVLAPAFSLARPPHADVVVCSSSGWAHGLRTEAPKVVYCHTPARWLYETDDYLPEIPQVGRWPARAVFPALRAWDRHAARHVDTYLANSTTVQRRIQRSYHIDAQVVYPPVLIDADGARDPLPDIEPGYLLVVSRKRSYKHVADVCEAVERLPGERVVVVGGLPQRASGEWSSRIRGMVDLSDAQIRWAYANARALVSMSHEDFGLTPLEAYAFGTPALLLRAGGYLDSSVEGVTCVYVDDPTPASIAEGIVRLRGTTFSTAKLRAHAGTFSEGRFHERIREVAFDAVSRRRAGRTGAATTRWTGSGASRRSGS